MKTKFCRWFILLAGLLLAGSAFANTVPVTNLVVDGAPGSLRAAITIAAPDDGEIDIQVAGTMQLTNELDIPGSLNIVNTSGGTVTIQGLKIISTNFLVLPFRVFNISAGATNTISGITISSGQAGKGGGILNAGNLTLQNCIISGNTAQGGFADGGGIYSSGPLTLVNCLVTGNTVSPGDGAGIDVDIGGTLAMTNCTVSFNASGGGWNGGPITGGGIYLDSDGTLVNCTIASNSITTGTAGYGQGSGVFIDNEGSVILISCTVSGNSAGANGVGGGISDLEQVVTLENTIVSGNSVDPVDGGTDLNGDFISNGFNLIGDGTDGAGIWLASDQFGTSSNLFDPALGPLQDNGGPTPTMAPALYSPVVNQGNTFGITTDQRGLPRLFKFRSIPNLAGGDGCDIGAVELQYVPVLSIDKLPNSTVISWSNSIINGAPVTFSNGPIANVPDFGIQKIIDITGVDNTNGGGVNPLALFKYPIRIVDHHYEIKDDLTDTDGVPIAIAFFQANSAITNPYVPPPVTGPAINIMATTATLTGTNYPAGSNTVYWFDYGMDTNYGSFTGTNGPLAISTNPTPVSVDIIGLTNSTTYHFQLMASDSDYPGLQYGGDQSFATLAPPTAPAAVTQMAAPVTSVNAQLNGTVNPNGGDTTWFFEYGYDTSYSIANTASEVVSASNTNPVPVNILAGGLYPMTTYHCQLVASNSAGVSLGGDQQFTTPGLPPQVATLGANPVGTTTATLNGTVNGEGSATAGYFQYGPAADDYTNDTSGNRFYGPANYSPTYVSTAISGLVPNTTYHYDTIAYGASEGMGGDTNFTTLSVPPTLLSPTNGANVATQSPTFTWSGANGTTTYGLYLAQFGQSGYTIVFSTTVTGTSYTYTGTLPTGSYVWYMTSFNSQGVESAPSSSFSLGILQRVDGG
jgi:hypothetical protein